MKKSIFTFVAVFCTLTLLSQSFNSPAEYLNYIGKEYKTISEGVLSYTSAVAHGKSARKVEKRRQEMISNIKDAKTKIGKMSDYDGNLALRDSALTVLELNYIILHEDYSKIVDMEAVAEQSYDAMEAYLLAQDLASERLRKAGERLSAVQDKFIADNNITIIDNKENDEIENKMKQLAQVNSYHRVVYLIFFKCYKQEFYLIDALNRNDLSAIEQNKNTLLEFANEGLAKLDTMKSFNSDMTLVNTCKDMINFYKDESENSMPVLIDYILKSDNFTKIKTAFESKKDKEKTQKDVDDYNNAVNDMNNAGAKYTSTNNKLNADRKKLIDSYNNASSKFMDKHVPHFSK
jgi:hypothetical protein